MEISRIELNYNTLHNEIRNVPSIKSIYDTATSINMPVLAITHIASKKKSPSFYEKLQKAFHSKSIKKSKPLKVIYGIEIDVVDDLTPPVQSTKTVCTNDIFTVIDIETSGLSPKKDNIIKISATKLHNNKIIDHYVSLINPGYSIPLAWEKMSGITDDMLMASPFLEDVLPDFVQFCQDSVLVAHNAPFVLSFIKAATAQIGLSFNPNILDISGLAQRLIPKKESLRLDSIEKNLGIKHSSKKYNELKEVYIFQDLLTLIKQQRIKNLAQINLISLPDITLKKTGHYSRIIVIAKNKAGLQDINEIITASLSRGSSLPLITTKSAINKYRTNCLIGCCYSYGELMDAEIGSQSNARIREIFSFYDYIEISMTKNYKSRHVAHSSLGMQDLLDINRQLIYDATLYNVPVIATSHDLMATEELLNEFIYLGAEKSKKIVIDNPCHIASMIEPTIII